LNIHAYRCLQTLVNFALSRDKDYFADYQSAFNKMYGTTVVNDMWQYVIGNKRFYGLFAVDNNLTEFTAHQQLLSVYNKLHQTML